MEDRREIREGAGLEEARLNQDFIEFLRRWSTPILVVIALVAVGYAGYTRWKEREHQKHDNAYAEFERVAGVASPSPESLRRIAEDYEGIGAVSILARLQAADVYLQAVRRGVRPGGQVDAQGAVTKPEDVLNDQDRATYLDQAQQLYSLVADKARRDDAQMLMAIGATYGLAAVAECRGEFDAAKKQYEAVEAMVKDTPYSHHAMVARERAKNLESIRQARKLYAKAELPATAVAPPAPWEAPATPAPAASVPGPEVVPAGPPVDDLGPPPPPPSGPPETAPQEPAPEEPSPSEAPSADPASSDPTSPRSPGR